MIRWNYITKKLVDKYVVAGPLGGHWTREHLMRTWKSLFDFRPGTYYDPNSMSENYGILYNFFMTLASLPDIPDKEKIDSILLLIKEITGSLDDEYIQAALRTGGCNEEITIDPAYRTLRNYGQFHPQIIKHCDKLFDDGHYLNCINEVCKAYNKAVQQKSQSSKDGQDLMMSEFGEKGGLRVNANSTDTEKNEQIGLMFLSAGVIRGFRNPTSHETTLSWKISKQECVEILGLVSFLYRQLDKATKNPK